MINFNLLREKALEIRKATINLQRFSAGFRLASSLSDVEIFVTLYYSGVMEFNPQVPNWEERDRFITSKGHGSISMYPILADLGFFDKNELQKISSPGSFLGDIPDTRIPGFETINGALGHGLGVACGKAIALKRKESDSRVFCLISDGELYEGSVWEAIMFASQHKLGNLILMVDSNKKTMLDYLKNIIDLEPIDNKFKSFNWETAVVDGHNIEELYNALDNFRNSIGEKPKVVIANTTKGKGVAILENDPLCHVRSLKPEEIDKAIEELK